MNKKFNSNAAKFIVVGCSVLDNNIKLLSLNVKTLKKLVCDIWLISIKWQQVLWESNVYLTENITYILGKIK